MKRFWLLAVAAGVTAGCGGGGGGSENPPAGGDFELSGFSGRALGTNPPVVSSGYATTVVGLTGTITALRLRDQQFTSNELRIVFASNMQNISGNLDLYSVNYDGTDLVRITDTPGINELFPEVAPDGKKIAFSAVGPGGDLEIYVMNIDGSNRVQLTNNAVDDRFPAWAPTSTSVVFESNMDIVSVNVASKVVTNVLVGPEQDYAPDYTSDGQSVVFTAYNRNGDSLDHVYRVPAAGGDVTPIFFNPGSSQYQARCAPNGYLYALRTGSGWQYRPLVGVEKPGPMEAVGDLQWSPDSSQFLYTTAGLVSVAMPPPSSLFVSNLSGGEAIEILPEIAGFKFSPSFVAAPKDVAFVGVGSLFGSRLSGFMFSQATHVGRSVGVVGVDATTPSTGVLVASGPASAYPLGNIVFTYEADTVTEVVYAQAPYWKPTRVVGGSTGVTAADGVLVSFDSLTGKVVGILPFNGTRSSAGFRDEGNTRVFTGDFLTVYDGSGKNLGKASEVRLDVSTGTLSIGG
jgi:dipeptidyl aminopeptidase/acylaminoacyl peptidase